MSNSAPNEVPPPSGGPRRPGTTPLAMLGGAAAASVIMAAMFVVNRPGDPGFTGRPVPTATPTAVVSPSVPPATTVAVAEAPIPAATVTVVQQAEPATTVIVPAPQATRTIIQAPPQATYAFPSVNIGAGKECSRNGNGPYAAAGTANSTTTCGFAINVRDAYIRSGINGGSGHIYAYSPTTKMTYDMWCSGYQPTWCSGGVNGRVIIYGGARVS